MDESISKQTESGWIEGESEREGEGRRDREPKTLKKRNHVH